MAEWFFTQLGPNDKHRNPMQGEFFRNDDPGSEARMLVREGIQNSLDAGAEDRETPVSVRIHASGKKGVVRWADISWIFDDVWPHYEAPRNGLVKRFLPERSPGMKCPFLVFEDFGTTGLIGDIEQTNEPDEAEDNPFYYFMRAEGESGKGGSARGRWGLGKFVFPKASLVRSFLAVTRREGESQNLLAGQYVLKCHKVDGIQYSPDAWFGKLNEDGVQIPSSDERAAAEVERIFSLQRGQRPGLSLIIPWCQEQINEKTLVTSVIRDFYFPIMRGQLVVEVSGPGGSHVLNEDSFESEFEKCRAELGSDAACIDLARAAVGSLGSVRFRLERRTDGKPGFDDLELPEMQLEAMRELDAAGELVSVRVPVKVESTARGEQAEFSHFEIWMRKDRGLDAGKPTFIREGLIIPEAARQRLRTHVAVVLIEDAPLARLLGDAENPAHTNWSFQSENFVGKYRHGKEVIKLVKDSVRAVVSLIRGEDDERDHESLADLFCMPDPDRKGAERGRGGGGGKREPADPPNPVLSDECWTHHAVKDGVVISGRAVDWSAAVRLNIKFAYDRQKGSPASSWKPADFELNRRPVKVSVAGSDLVRQERCDANCLEVVVKGPDFKIQAGGFDGNRDLWFDVTETEVR